LFSLLLYSVSPPKLHRRDALLQIRRVACERDFNQAIEQDFNSAAGERNDGTGGRSCAAIR
jgi:hypothetical protein